MDYFDTLSTLRLTDSLSSELVAKATNKIVKENLTTYYFNSEKYSRPHRIIVDTNLAIQEIALTLPKSQIEIYKSKLQDLGQPESIKQLNKDETILGYPSKGLSFFIDETEMPIELVRLKPVSNQEFIEEKLNVITQVPQFKNFSPENSLVSEQQDAQPSIGSEAKSPSSYSPVWLLGVAVLLISILAIWVWYYFRKPNNPLPPATPV